MPILQTAAGLFAVYMLVRYVPAAMRALRRSEDQRPGRAVVPILNVLLALAILALAVKGLAGLLISR